MLIKCAKCNRKNIPRGQVSSDILSSLVYKKGKSHELRSVILDEENQQAQCFDQIWCNYYLVLKNLYILSRSMRLSAISIRVTNPKVNCVEWLFSIHHTETSSLFISDRTSCSDFKWDYCNRNQSYCPTGQQSMHELVTYQILLTACHC